MKKKTKVSKGKGKNPSKKIVLNNNQYIYIIKINK